MTIPENVPTIVVVSPWRSVWTAFYAPSQAKLVFWEGICSGACESEKWCEVALIRRSQSTQVFVSGFSRMFPDLAEAEMNTVFAAAASAVSSAR